MKCFGIDLHIHSTASDGTVTPPDILQLAIERNLGAISITDHDTLDGVKEALASGIPDPIKFLTGIEISSDPPPGFSIPGSLHILGYGINTENKQLNRMLVTLQDARLNRNPKIIERLNRFGLDVSLTEVQEKAGTGQAGRPHIAMVMVEKGMAASVNEVFNRFLGKGMPAYVDKPRIASSEVIRTILNAGGVPVLAHPGLLKSESSETIQRLVDTLKQEGLKGIEVYYPRHTPALIEEYINLARRNDLLITGGSDFHGLVYPDIEMGSGNGDGSIPYSIFDELVKEVATHDPFQA